jgi:hypothetical protein
MRFTKDVFLLNIKNCNQNLKKHFKFEDTLNSNYRFIGAYIKSYDINFLCAKFVRNEFFSK